MPAATMNPPVTMPVVERCSNAEWGGVPAAATAAKSPRILDSPNEIKRTVPNKAGKLRAY